MKRRAGQLLSKINVICGKTFDESSKEERIEARILLRDYRSESISLEHMLREQTGCQGFVIDEVVFSEL